MAPTTTEPEPAAPPLVHTALQDFAYERRGGWCPSADGATALGPGHPLPVDFAEEFHEASKMQPGRTAQALGPAGGLLLSEPHSYLALGRKSLTCSGAAVSLPLPHAVPAELLSVIRRRRSRLPDVGAPVPLSALATLLAASAGAIPGRPDRRAHPSAGALYPLDVVVLANEVDGLDRGMYVYDPIGHGLLPRGEVDPTIFHSEAGDAIAPNQPAVTLALVATFARSRAKYGLRGYRFALIEAGHLAQNVLLVATGLGLASLAWGGYIDSAADRLLELDGLERSCVYLVGISAEQL